jgi:Capsule assembly protein Wzi
MSIGIVGSSMRLTQARIVAVMLFLLASPLPALAGASLPYTPSWMARHSLAQLSDEAGLSLPLSHWPLPSAAVRSALEALPTDLPEALAQARDAVLADLDRADHPLLIARVRTQREAPVGFADDYVPGSSLTIRSGSIGAANATGNQAWAFGVGARFEQQAGSLLEGTTQTVGAPAASSARLDDSALVFEGAGINLQAFAHLYWWGPSWQDSLILGNNAPAWMGVGVQRSEAMRSLSPWLSWLGPWNAEFFVAKAQDPTVATNQPQGFLFMGARATIKPHPLVELGLTRTWQTAGKGRPSGLGNFFRALLATDTNPPGPKQQAEDPGNEMAGFDLRVACGGIARCAFYGQVIGEDHARYVPTKYLSLFGAETWSEDGRSRWFVEYANTSCHSLPWEHELQGCAYRNSQYPQGYTNGGRWIGASFGPDSRVTTLGWYSVSNERRLRVHTGRVGVSLGAYGPGMPDAPHGALVALGADQAFHVGPTTLTGTLNWTHLRDGIDVGANRRSNLQLGFAAAWPLD